MRLPRSRLTVRWMMLAVAAAVVMLVAVVVPNRRANFAERAEFHRQRAEPKYGFTSNGMSDEEMREAFASLQAVAARDRMLAPYAFHRLMARKYDRAARSPWLPVAPDPDSEVQRRVQVERVLEYFAARRARLHVAPDPPEPE